MGDGFRWVASAGIEATLYLYGDLVEASKVDYKNTVRPAFVLEYCAKKGFDPALFGLNKVNFVVKDGTIYNTKPRIYLYWAEDQLKGVDLTWFVGMKREILTALLALDMLMAIPKVAKRYPD